MPEAFSPFGIVDLVSIVAPLIIGALLGEHLGVVIERRSPRGFSALPQLGTALGVIAGGLAGIALARAF